MAPVRPRVTRVRRTGSSLTQGVLADLRGAAHYAADQAIKAVKAKTRAQIRAVGLGNLANAVDVTSTKKLQRTNSDKAYGAIYAKRQRGVTNRGEQTLLAYSQGASIVPRAGRRWLAFATNALPKRAGARGAKLTPAGYEASGLTQSIGKLVFVPRSSRLAWLIVRKVTISRRTGRARASGSGKPRGSDRRDFIIAFILIRFTSRAQRFDQDEIVAQGLYDVPRYAQDYQGRAG